MTCFLILMPPGETGGFGLWGGRRNRSGTGGVVIGMRVMKIFCAGLAVAVLAAVGSAQEREPLPFRRPGALCLKLDLPLFADTKTRDMSSLTALPHYVGSDKSIAAEPRSIRTIAHLGYIGLAVAGALVNPAFLVIAAYHVVGLVKDAENKHSERRQDISFIWSRS